MPRSRDCRPRASQGVPTGRPAGWCDHIARMWPVDGVSARTAPSGSADRERRLQARYSRSDPPCRGQPRRRPPRADPAGGAGGRLASDQPYREADLAIDFCEDVPPLALPRRIVSSSSSSGRLHAKVSSIHVNGWFGDYDKLAMTPPAVRGGVRQRPETAATAMVFVGDSPNDGPMFECSALRRRGEHPALRAARCPQRRRTSPTAVPAPALPRWSRICCVPDGPGRLSRHRRAGSASRPVSSASAGAW